MRALIRRPTKGDVMKKIGWFVVMGILSLSLSSCGVDPCKESTLTNLGDSIATLGKKGLEKEKILADRKAERAVACAKKKGEELKKSMGL